MLADRIGLHLDNGDPGTSNDLQSRATPGNSVLLPQLLHNLEQVVSDLLATAFEPTWRKDLQLPPKQLHNTL